MLPWKTFGIPMGLRGYQWVPKGSVWDETDGSYGLSMGIPMGCLRDSQLGTFGAPWGRGIAIGFPWGSLWCSEGPPMGFLRDSRGDTRGERCSPPPPNRVLDNILDLVYLFEEYKLFGLCRNIHILWLCGGLGKWNIH